MHGRRYNSRTGVLRRCLAGCVLVTFTLGNVGWPGDAATTAAGRGRCAMTGAARCCCGGERSKSTCGCFQAPVLAQKAGCCQKKWGVEKSPVSVVDCQCNDSSFPGFVVSAQPRIASALVEAPGLTSRSAAPAAALVILASSRFAPETPPPRTSVS